MKFFVVILFLAYPFKLFSADAKSFLRPELIADDPILSALFEESVDVAIESIQTANDGSHFLSAGPRYGNPPRTYYRDSYWTAGLVLMINPLVVREQILQLASGVEPNGSVPSAITVDSNELKIPLWNDHHDSGSFFIMMVYDYLRWTGDETILNEYVGNRTVFVTMEDILTHLFSLDTNLNYLPEKPSDSLQDWLDTIPRGGEVLYNQVLYYRALRNMVEIATVRGYPTHATVFHRHSLLVRHQINKMFWNKEKGYFFERCEADVCIDRLTNESSLAVLYEVISPSNRNRFFDSLKKLETSWGVMNAVPAYGGFALSKYHNATDWPVLDGMNAGARLKYNNADWYYPLTRWWTYFNEVRGEGEKLPEFISPNDLTGGRSQAWSVNPSVSLIRYGLGLDPAMDGSYTIKPSPQGNITLKNVQVRGQRLTVQAKQKKTFAD